ncbi:MAG: hypothetical protein U9Q68_06445 [Euryarchaeota archaeon]|nr:hypothetical protein [Euryarchaeota archaeon]
MSTAIICPRCGGSNCVIPTEYVLESIASMYAACQSCAPDPRISKQLPFHQLDQPFRNIDDSTMRCRDCGKRHLDIAIAHVLKILVREGLRARDATLSDVGTPMITIGYPVPFPPRLGRDMLILVMDTIDKGTAEMLVNEVSEVKGVIERKGEPGRPVGILDTDHAPHIYNLLAGCDVRGDVVSSAFGDLCIYKTQSDTHIEFSRAESGKTGVLESLYYQRKLEGVVVDGCCGAGTLGLVAVLAGAREVILNDAFRPAVENTILNIKANASVLGLDPEPEIHTDISKLTLMAGTGTPRLVATVHGAGASGHVNITVYHSDLADLAAVIDHCNLCLIDAFIGVSTDRFVQAWKERAELIVTI